MEDHRMGMYLRKGLVTVFSSLLASIFYWILIPEVSFGGLLVFFLVMALVMFLILVKYQKGGSR